MEWEGVGLTHWGRDKMASVLQTTLSNTFSWMRLLQLRLRFHWSLFPRVQSTIFQHWFRWLLCADQVTNHYLNQWWFDYRCIYLSLGLNELIAPTPDGSKWQIRSCKISWHLTDCGLATSYSLKYLGQHWGARQATSHFLKLCWLIV